MRDPNSTPEDTGGDARDPSGSPRQIGPYRILDQIGEGGMGVVYVAEQREPVRRKVALKVIKQGMDTKEVLARFEVEHHALTLMNHPGIARVLDAGASDQGRPYFVMEYVPGVPITEFCDREKLRTRERLELFLGVCSAVQHAHQKGIIHRDLKPSNVLVMLQDGEPVQKIIDFGVAKAIANRLTEHTLYTEIGQTIGTPEYMSPEQAEMSGTDIDTRTDVYSLGVLLYELLVGRLPFDSKTLRSSGLAEIQRIIREVDPARPSTRLHRGDDETRVRARSRRSDVRTLTRRIRGDLDWITLKALEKNPNRRYDSAAALADDIRRHLAHEPVAAGPPSAVYKLRKFARKNRTLVSATGLVFLALVVGLVAAWTQYRRAEEERALADQRYDEIIRLADLKRVRDANTVANTLWPAYPDRVAALETWIQDRGHPLAANLPRHRAQLAKLQAEGKTDEESAWQQETLEELVRDLEAFTDPAGTLPSVESRLEFARRVEADSITGPEGSARWKEAIADIRQLEIYGGLEMPPQIGLLPLGRDPESGLWEFWHLQTGERPAPHPDPEAASAWLMEEATGLVLVLIPAGTFTMGSQKDDPEAPGYYPYTDEVETPRHPVTLDAFFLSKYEMTQAQWLRFVGRNPSRYGPGHQDGGNIHTLMHPVESISWREAKLVLDRLGLELPTEAQWEYAARAGTDTPWWTGPEVVSLQGAANVSDRYAREHGVPESWASEMGIDDGYVLHAPIGLYRASPFGLHDVHGNVWEICRDHVALYHIAPAPGDGLRTPSRPWHRVTRGGSFQTNGIVVRSAFRYPEGEEERHNTRGVRPSRSVAR